MVTKYVRALALRVAYHIQQKLPDLHGQPTRTLVMMVSAFIPYHGRALPLGCFVLEKAMAKGSMTAVEEDLLGTFAQALPEWLRHRIVILADRGFAKSDLMEKLLALGFHWVIRLPRNQNVQEAAAWKALSEIPLAPGETRILHDVRIIESSPVNVQLALRRMPPGHKPMIRPTTLGTWPRTWTIPNRR